MNLKKSVAHMAATAVLAVTLAGCGSTGGLGEILGGVLGGGAQPASGNQVTGTIESVDTRNQQVVLRQGNGQTAAIGYDSRTQVVYQQQNYEVTALEYGDEVVMRYQQNGNSYYTDLIEVTRSVSSNTSGNTGTTNGSVYTVQGTVSSINRTNGVFNLRAENGTTVTVVMPYTVRTSDADRFRRLRNGDYIRVSGVYTSNSRLELRSFD